MMKIVKQTPSLLTLQHKTTIANLWFPDLFILPFAIPLFIFSVYYLLNAGVTTLTCQRLEPTQVNCESKQSKFVGFWQDSPTSVKNVVGARLVSSKEQSEEGGGVFDYQVNLVTKTGEVRIAGVDLLNTNSIVPKVNSFFKSNQASLIVQVDTELSYFSTVSFVVVSCVFSLCLLTYLIIFHLDVSETLTFDKEQNTLISYSEKLLRKKYNVPNYKPLDSIKSLEIKTNTDSDGDNTYTLKMWFTNGTEKILRTSSDLQDVQILHDTIQYFLELKPQA